MDKNIMNKYIFLLLCLIPVFFVLYIIINYSVNVLYLDDWDIVWRLKNLYENKISFDDIMSQHNESIIAFPSILMVFLSYISELDVRINMYISFVFFLLILYIFYRVFKNEKINKNFIYFIPVSYILFSLRGYENILWGFQIVFSLPLFSSIFSIYLFSKFYENLDKRYNYLNLIFSILFLIITCFSIVPGFILFLIFILITFFYKKENYINIILLLSFLFFGSLFFYLLNYNNPVNISYFEDLSTSIFDIIEFFMIIIGNSIINEFYYYSITAGLIILFFEFIIILNLIKKRVFFKRNIFWVCLNFYFLFTLFTISIGRSGYGHGQAMISRYSIFSVIFLISVYFLIYDLFRENKQNKLAIVILVFFIGYNFIPTQFICFKYVDRTHSERIFMKYVLQNYNSFSDFYLKRLFVSPERLKERSIFLEKNKLNVFKDKGILNLEFTNNILEKKFVNEESIDISVHKEFTYITGSLKDEFFKENTLYIKSKQGFVNVFLIESDKIPSFSSFFRAFRKKRINKIYKNVFFISLRNEDIKNKDQLLFVLKESNSDKKIKCEIIR